MFYHLSLNHFNYAENILLRIHSKELKRTSVTSSSLESHVICLHSFNVDGSNMRAYETCGKCAEKSQRIIAE